jgi:hypothetical protein
LSEKRIHGDFFASQLAPQTPDATIPNGWIVFMRGCRRDIKHVSPRLRHTGDPNWLFLRHVAKRSRKGISKQCYRPNNMTLQFC